MDDVYYSRGECIEVWFDFSHHFCLSIVLCAASAA
jgi:hypothetical protein